MRTLFTILCKELRGFFLSPFGWVVLLLFSAMQAWSLSNAMKVLEGEPIRDSLVFLVFHTRQFWFYFLVIFPLLTMRLFAGEEREGTLETLLTAPVQTWHVVLGKYFATLIFFSILWVPAFLHFELFTLLTDVPPPFPGGSLFGAFLLVFLMGAFFIAIGCLASSLTSSAIIAAVVTIGLLFIHHFLGYVTVISDREFKATPFFHYISPIEHLHSFTIGLIDSRPIVYYVTMSAFCLFLTHHVINYRRWKS